jgi:hypothetical protein
VTPSSSPVARGVVLGLRLGLERLRERRTAGALLLAFALAVAGAWIELAAGSLGSVDRALGDTFRLIVPLLTYALVSRAVSRDGLGPGVFPLARFGVPRFAAALGVASGAALASAVASAALAAVTVLLAHSSAAPPLAMDVLASSWIGFAAGLAYAGWVALGATYFRGRGRFWPIAADFIVGGTTGLAGAILPRSHALHLAGIGPAPLAMPPSGSFGALFAMGILLLLAAAVRTGR